MKKICAILLAFSFALTLMSLQSSPVTTIGSDGSGGLKKCRDGSSTSPPFFKRVCNVCKTRFANWSGRNDC